MEQTLWNNQYWTQETKLPKGVKRQVFFLILGTILLGISFFYYHYPVYQTFYGIVIESEKNELQVIVPVSEIDTFQKAIKNNKKIKLKKIHSDLEVVNGQSIVVAQVVMSISKKLLVKNNIVPIRLQIENMSLFEEKSQKWKRGLNDEKN